jgi:hypothetical protein
LIQLNANNVDRAQHGMQGNGRVGLKSHHKVENVPDYRWRFDAEEAAPVDSTFHNDVGVHFIRIDDAAVHGIEFNDPTFCCDSDQFLGIVEP